MPTPITGSLYERKNGWHARITIAPKRRRSFDLPTCATREAAEERSSLLAAIAVRLQGHARLEPILELVGRAHAGNDLAALLRHVDATERGEWATAPARGKTFQQVGDMWTSGEIARLYPDRVVVKSNAWKDEGLLNKHVYPIVRDVSIAAFTLEHADAVMRALPASYASGSRKQIAMLVSRILGLAAFPLKLIAVSPLPKGWIPRRGPGKALSYLYPDEDARLVGCERVPLPLRVYYGFLDREGMRGSEAEGLEWSDVDLQRGAVTLDKNKTSDPRAWALSPGMARALSTWKEIQREEYGESEVVFLDEEGEPIAQLHHKHRAESFRAHLLLADVNRPALHERSPERRPIRAHDLRATFITIALANGKTEAWVADRTGHRSSHMINRYRRAARTVAELGLGDLLPLDEAIPELRERARQQARGGTAGGTVAITARGPRDTKPLSRRGRSSRPGSWRGTAGGSNQDGQPGLIAAVSAGHGRVVRSDEAVSPVSVPPREGVGAASGIPVEPTGGHLFVLIQGGGEDLPPVAPPPALRTSLRRLVLAEAAEDLLRVGDVRAARLLVTTMRVGLENEQLRRAG